MVGEWLPYCRQLELIYSLFGDVISYSSFIDEIKLQVFFFGTFFTLFLVIFRNYTFIFFYFCCHRLDLSRSRNAL